MNNFSGIYFHIPFCPKKCLYCDFFSVSGCPQETLKRYGKSLFNEAHYRLGELSGTKIVSVYFGGGSPTSMNEDFFRNFAGFAVKSGINLEDCEVTVEVNPADRSEKWIRNLKDCGINRVSIGVQAFDDLVLAGTGRRTTVADMRKNIPVFAKYVDNVSCDIIYGLGKNRDINQELMQIFELAPFRHVSAYRYSRPERENAPELLDEDETLRQEAEIRNFLQKRGFSRYEISNYSLPGFESRHNMLYWTCGSWLGIGAGAASFIRKTGVSSRYADDIEAFVSGEGLSSVKLTLKEKIEEFLLMGLRVKVGINLNDFKELFGKDFFELISEKAVLDLVSNGLLEFGENKKILKCTERGSDFLNAVLIKLFDVIRC
ncbi:coproporphyrinogen III oxidase family protein [bacterium]|nr:coproporphyrinogen III oxidase family protein [bacterium]